MYTVETSGQSRFCYFFYSLPGWKRGVMRLVKSMRSPLKKEAASAESRNMVGSGLQFCISYSPPTMVHGVDVEKKAE